MAPQSTDLKEICRNPDISKAPTGISSEMELALGRKSDDYLTGHGQQWIRRAHSGKERRGGMQLREKSH
jgi:hypothetical protein